MARVKEFEVVVRPVVIYGLETVAVMKGFTEKNGQN